MADTAALIAAALTLGAADVGTLTNEEIKLADKATVPAVAVNELRAAIAEGRDPLGDAFCELFSPIERRPNGATYTPAGIVESMLGWAQTHSEPVRIVDPGAGSGRFTVAAGRAFPDAELVASERDPLAALITRAHLAAAGLADRSRVEVGDFRNLALEQVDGATLFIGNPPYVRHHQIEPSWKAWLARTAQAHGHRASGLAGLHVHFFLAALALGRPGDVGVFITAAEWLDVNYGKLVRDMLLDGLGGRELHVLEPEIEAFPDAQTTAAITCFEIGASPEAMNLRRVATVEDLTPLAGGQPVGRGRLAEASRWTPLTRTARAIPKGYIELGELCRVHRGAVTGANDVWIVDPLEEELPEEVLFPSVTKARELFAAGQTLTATGDLRRVVDLPADLDTLTDDGKKATERFLRRARRAGAHKGYVARHRRAWWSVGLRDPAPLLSTYMARRPPAIVANPLGARHINIAHGLYPRQLLSDGQLERIAAALRSTISVSDGRTYAGGLTKFEPRELERMLIPDVTAA